MTDVTEYLAWFVLGLALGAVYLFLLNLSVRALAAPGNRIGAAWPLVLRLGAAVVSFYLAAQSGPVPVFIVLSGFLMVRTAALRFVREGG